MPKVQAREVIKSETDHPQDLVDLALRRQSARGPVGHTSESPQQPPTMYNRQTADPRDKFWRSLGKQVRQGAGVRVTVRG